MPNDTLALELLLEDYLDQIRELVKEAKGAEPDLSGIAAAIATLRYPTSEEIAQAIAKVVRFPAPTDLTPMLERVAKAMEHLEKQRPQAATVGFGNQKVEVRNFPPTQAVNVTNPDVRVTNVTAQEIGTGKFNIYGSGRITLSVAGNLRATLKNPAGSGKTVKVHRISALGTSTGWATIYINPTTGLPISAARPSLNAIVGGGIAGIAEVRADSDTTTALGGGTDTGIVLGIPGGSRTELNLPPLIIAPGVTVGFNVPFAGAADVALAVYTTEV